MYARILLVSGLICLGTVIGCRQEAADSETTALDAYFEDVMERLEILGIALAVTRDGEVVYTGAFGVRSLESGEPVRPESLFHMASVSKPFVATAVMQLVEKGKVDLDEGIGLILASNYDRTPMGTIRDGVLDILLGHDPTRPKRQVGMAFAGVYAEKGLDAAKELYRRLETEAAEEYDFDDRQLDEIGYYYLAEKQVPRAIEILEFNVELFPDVGNTYDSLGKAYLADGKRELARANCRRALELDPENDHAMEMLARLGG